MARYGRLDLLLLDELNYVHLDPRRAELLFQVLTERVERASVAVASNAPVTVDGAKQLGYRPTAFTVVLTSGSRQQSGCSVG